MLLQLQFFFFYSNKNQSYNISLNPFNYLLNIFLNDNTINENYLTSIIYLLSDILTLIKNNLEFLNLQSYIERLIFLSKLNFNINLEYSLEEASILFESISSSFIIIIKNFKEDIDLLEFLLPNIFKFFDNIWKLKAFDKNSLQIYLSLIYELIELPLIKNKFNRAINRTSIKEILNEFWRKSKEKINIK